MVVLGSYIILIILIIMVSISVSDNLKQRSLLKDQWVGTSDKRIKDSVCRRVILPSPLCFCRNNSLSGYIKLMCVKTVSGSGKK